MQHLSRDGSVGNGNILPSVSNKSAGWQKLNGITSEILEAVYLMLPVQTIATRILSSWN